MRSFSTARPRSRSDRPKPTKREEKRAGGRVGPFVLAPPQRTARSSPQGQSPKNITVAGSSLFALLDDIATVLDDVAVMTKVAAKKTAGVLGDDLALNA